MSTTTTPVIAGLRRHLVVKLLRRGEFSSREDLVAKMLAFVEHHSETAKPFKWVYKAKLAA